MTRTDSSSPATAGERRTSAAAPVPIARGGARRQAPLALVAASATAALLAISPIPAWAMSIRDVVGNGFARIVYEASAWSSLLSPWMPIGVVVTTLAGVAAVAYWLSAPGSRGRVLSGVSWVGLGLLGSLVLAAALLPGVLDTYRGPNGFHEMHLRPLYFVGVILAVAVLSSGIGALLAVPAGRRR